ncbi:hypothetical protein T439DRAFT_377459 [Meredithblackwellia eburnea MCA 4105]
MPSIFKSPSNSNFGTPLERNPGPDPNQGRHRLVPQPPPILHALAGPTSSVPSYLTTLYERRSKPRRYTCNPLRIDTVTPPSAASSPLRSSASRYTNSSGVDPCTPQSRDLTPATSFGSQAVSPFKSSSAPMIKTRSTNNLLRNIACGANTGEEGSGNQYMPAEYDDDTPQAPGPRAVPKTMHPGYNPGMPRSQSMILPRSRLSRLFSSSTQEKQEPQDPVLRRAMNAIAKINKGTDSQPHAMREDIEWLLNEWPELEDRLRKEVPTDELKKAREKIRTWEQ